MTESEFEEVVREYQSMVYSIAYNFFGNAALAEEIAQDVFLQLYENRSITRSHSHVISWLRRVTTHRCIDVLRHRRIQSEVNIEELQDVSEAGPQRDPLLEDKLRKLVASLPTKQRMVV